jgi:hypothetical protein
LSDDGLCLKALMGREVQAPSCVGFLEKRSGRANRPALQHRAALGHCGLMERALFPPRANRTRHIELPGYAGASFSAPHGGAQPAARCAKAHRAHVPGLIRTRPFRLQDDNGAPNSPRHPVSPALRACAEKQWRVALPSAVVRVSLRYGHQLMSRAGCSGA